MTYLPSTGFESLPYGWETFNDTSDAGQDAPPVQVGGGSVTMTLAGTRLSMGGTYQYAMNKPNTGGTVAFVVDLQPGSGSSPSDAVEGLSIAVGEIQINAFLNGGATPNALTVSEGYTPGGGTSVELPFSPHFTVSVAFHADGGAPDVYINGTLVLPGQAGTQSVQTARIAVNANGSGDFRFHTPGTATLSGWVIDAWIPPLDAGTFCIARAAGLWEDVQMNVATSYIDDFDGSTGTYWGNSSIHPL